MLMSARAGACLFLFLSMLAAKARAEDFIVGIGTHVTSERGLALIQQAGITNLRDDIHWSEVEREKGVLAMPARYENYVNDALRHGIQPVLILCYGNNLYDGGGDPTSPEASEAFTRFAEFVVTHFKGRVQKYEVWNEWNTAIGLPPGSPRGKPEPYVALLRKVYPRLKALNPEITIIGGAFSGNAVGKGWLESACKAGLLDNLDAFSFHPYCFRLGSEDRLPENGFLKQIRDSQEVTRRYQKRDIPIYITEVGWPNHYGPDGSTPQDSARFLARAFLLARTMPFIRAMWWYDFLDDGVDPNEREDHFGLVARDLSPKPAYSAMSEICHLFDKARYDGEIKADPAVHILKFRKPSGAELFAMWSLTDGEWQVTFEADSSQAPPVARIRDLGLPETVAAWSLEGRKWRINVPLTGAPCILETTVTPAGVKWGRTGAMAWNILGFQ